jgi:hypothetical protein
MAWDSSRPVPWQRMMREWLVYVAIMLVVIVVFFRDAAVIGVIAGLLVSGPLYLGFGFVMAKFGYQRKSWSELRSESRSQPGRSGDGDSAAGPRPKPAPTSRTGGTSTRPGGRRKRR